MAGIETTGWVTPAFQTLVDELAEAAKEEFGEDFATSPDSVFGQISNIFAASTKSLWDLGEAITATQNRDAAEGVYLNYLANLIGLTRLVAYGSSGQLLFVGSQGVTIPALYPCSDSLSRNVLTDVELTLNRALCYSSTFVINTVTDNTPYTIVVEGLTYTYTTGTGDTEDDILSGLQLAMSEDTKVTTEIVDSSLILTFVSKNNNLTTTNTTNITLQSIGSLVEATSATTGALIFEEGSITKLGSASLNIKTVTNLSKFAVGREAESDEELRLRMDEREQSTGTATKPAIEASLSEIEGVTGVLVKENNTLTTSLEGIPPKSYETFIVGGDDDEISKVLWETKPATISTYGDVSKIITDANGDEQVVSFSRKSEVIAWVRVFYSINSEENFPADGETEMKNSVVTYGNDMYEGEDFEPTKFYAPLYNTSGVFISSIEIATTPTITDTPVYQTTRIPVSVTEFLSFSTDRVSIST